MKGLDYNLTIHEQTNETNCISLPRKVKERCSGFYQHGLLPDLIGGEDVLTVMRHWESFFAVFNLLEGLCYTHMSELGCYVVVPKCDPVSRQVIHPCREMCHDFRTACSKIVINKNTVNEAIPLVSSVDKNVTLDATAAGFDCDYLPSLGGDIPCFYKPVTCGSPPSVQNAAMVNTSGDYNKYSALDTVDYSCNEGFQMEGNRKISCLISGQWSTPPKCTLTESSTVPLFVVLPALLIPLVILLVIIAVKFKIKSKADLKETNKPLLPRKRPFDAFIIYHFDSDDQFVVNDLVPALEEDRDFKLFIHSRDFILGRDIIDNIEEAIEGSNSAIIVMSQGFVDSKWGQEEFTHCYLENMKDESFNLFVIMMQPADTLINISNYMKTFFETKTYLKIDDQELFSKLATHLENAR